MDKMATCEKHTSEAFHLISWELGESEAGGIYATI
jgi:hypothetical protein